MVEVSSKKEFLKWFVTNKRVQSRDVLYLLNFLLAHHSLLNNIHFVENAKNAPRGIIISTNRSKPPLTYYKGEERSTSTDFAFHEMRLSQNSEWYLQLDFEGSHSNLTYLSLLKDISFSEDIPELTISDLEEIEDFLNHTLKLGEKQLLEKEINEALDSGDKEMFLKLTTRHAALTS